jgi:hypothetical protein
MPIPPFAGWPSSGEPKPKLEQVPAELRKYFRVVDGTFQWEAEALLTARGDKLEEIKGRLNEEYGINLLFDADAIYKILDRIYDLEKRVKDLEKRQHW